MAFPSWMTDIAQVPQEHWGGTLIKHVATGKYIFRLTYDDYTKAEEPILEWLYGMGMRAPLDGHGSAFSL